MVAGPNGSGKTTLTNQLRLSDVDFGRYINPDDIAKSLQGDYESRVREAQRIADQQRADCINEGMACADQVVLFDNSYGRPAIIRPFFRTMGLDFWREEDPIPDWARPALQTWHTQRARRLDERSNGEN